MRIRLASLVFLTMLLAQTAVALPVVKTASDTDDNSTITLSVLDRVIEGDQEAWCSVRLVIDGDSGYPVKTGDTVRLWVYEDDTTGDDLIYSTSFHPTSAEAGWPGNGLVDRTFDCSGNFGTDDYGDYVEVYAWAEVNWDCCYWDDEPETALIDVLKVSDDGAENDDAINLAKAIGLGTTGGRIANDSADWMSFQLTGTFTVDLAVLFNDTGLLLPRLENASATPVATFGSTDNGASASVTLGTGTYYLIVAPHTATNPNFYDVSFNLTPATCISGATESQDCGNCGTQIRQCIGSNWTLWGDCNDQGVCAEGATTTESCEKCGTRTTTCTETCAWGTAGDCLNQGACEEGEIEDQTCEDGGTRQRLCEANCTWGDWTTCGGAFCTENATRDCYTGPEGTQDVGACESGTQTCTDGTWGSCSGQALPALEICDDTTDNDCDGTADADDSDCGGVMTGIGAPCANDEACEDDYECVGPTEDPMFVGGYCGGTGCTADADCGAGVCLSIFARDYCLRTCTNVSDCRTGYMCIRVEGVKACIPRCTTNTHCRDTSYPVCDLDSGRCIEGTVTPDPSETVEPVSDAGQDPVVTDTQPDTVIPPDIPYEPATDTSGQTDTSADAGGEPQLEADACSCSPTRAPIGSPLWILVALGLIAIIRRRVG